MNHQYNIGWKKYNFNNLDIEEHDGHGSSKKLRGGLAFHRGLNNPHVTFSIIEPNTEGQGIGLHIHRNEITGKDAEVWYIILDGKGEMTFTNGDVISCEVGDMLVTYPGTGHSFRALDGPVKVIAVCPEMYTECSDDGRCDTYPEEFNPPIIITEYEKGSGCVKKAVCSVCGEEWIRPEYDNEAKTMPEWSNKHKHK